MLRERRLALHQPPKMPTISPSPARLTASLLAPSNRRRARWTLMGDLKLQTLDIGEVKAPTPGRKESIVEHNIGVHAA